MASAIPIFARSRLSHLTDSGITSLIDSANILSQVDVKNISQSDHIAYTIRANPNAQLSGDEAQTLIGRYATEDKIQFIYTKTLDKFGSSGSYLESLQVHFSNSNGSFLIEHANDQLSGVNYVFGPDLKGTVSISATPDNKAEITYAYTVYSKVVPEQTATFNLEPLKPITTL